MLILWLCGHRLSPKGEDLIDMWFDIGNLWLGVHLVVEMFFDNLIAMWPYATSIREKTFLTCGLREGPYG